MMYHYIIHMYNIPLPISLIIYNGLYPLDLRSKPQLRCADRSAQESLRCHQFSEYCLVKVIIFHSYVKLPEGTRCLDKPK